MTAESHPVRSEPDQNPRVLDGAESSLHGDSFGLPSVEAVDLSEDSDSGMSKGRRSALTKFLVVAISLVLCFAAGAHAQRKNDAGMVRPPSGPLAAIAGALGAAPGEPKAAPPAVSGGAPGEHAALAGAQLKGTLVAVDGSDVVVRDADGVEHKVTTSAQTLITKAAPLDGLVPGSMIYVAGTEAADGSLSAVSVIAP